MRVIGVSRGGEGVLQRCGQIYRGGGLLTEGYGCLGGEREAGMLVNEGHGRSNALSMPGHLMRGGGGCYFYIVNQSKGHVWLLKLDFDN